MKEQLISFETAKLAKEKGFGLKSANKYDDEGRIIEPILQVSCEIYYPFCSQSLLQKWLREKHGIFVSINVMPCSGLVDFNYIIRFSKDIGRVECSNEILVNNKFEEALEKGLKEALKLIQ